MTSYSSSRGYGDDGSSGQASWFSRADQLPEGSRRKRFAGYLKAANDLRVTYQQTAQDTWKNRNAADYDDDGGNDEFLDGSPAVVRKGQDYMILFPSYARKHFKRKPRIPRDEINRHDGISQSREGAVTGDTEFWREEWDKYEDDHAVVDVDVRGWLYTPHRGPMTRKQRIFISLARQLAGLPNPPESGTASGGSTPGRGSSPHPVHERMQAHNARKEEDMAAQQAQAILQKGQAEAENASRGRYSEKPHKDADEDSLIDFSDDGPSSRPPSIKSVDSSRRQSTIDASPLKQVTNADADGQIDPPIRPVQKRATWHQPADMSPSELSMANSNLMARLKPFLANPLSGLAISVFFYNDETSQQRTVYTDPDGHFSVRVPLKFLPTHVKILASDELSATEEVIVTPTRGVSVISDIDDTIKHSAIASGPREIFRNAFIRELHDLLIEGVQGLYTELAERGAKFHYVSNSPWQLYPVLRKYFELAGLPPGSFHLKQYSGMLQGIFEPVAERKKSTLDRLARDFPERSFILFGDSGEADLEVYTDFVHENPGRVLGVFIRDVTTTKGSGFFSYSHDPSPNMSPGGSPIGSALHSPRFSPRLSPRVSPKLNSAKRRSLTRNPKSFSLDDENDPELQAALKASMKDYEREQNGSRTPRPPPEIRNYETRSDSHGSRPTLPPRRTGPAAPEAHQVEADLIDLSDDTPPSKPPMATKPPDLLKPSKSAPDHEDRPQIPKKPSNMSAASQKTPSPLPPRKPVSLQGSSTPHTASEVGRDDLSSSTGSLKTPPPKPRRPSTSIIQRQQDEQNGTSEQPEAPGYISAAEQKLASAYEALPSVRDKLPNVSSITGAKRAPLPPPTLQQSATTNAAASSGRRPPAPPPPRRTTTSSSAAARERMGGGLTHSESMPLRSSTTSRSDTISPYSTRASTLTDPSSSPRLGGAGRTGSYRSEHWDQQQQPQGNKKEQLWRQRWLTASEIMRKKGVVLKSWRVGADIEKDVLGLMDEALQREKEGKGPKTRRLVGRGSSLEQ